MTGSDCDPNLTQVNGLPSPWGVRVTAASRLSFTLIDLNGEGGRRNGMASLSLAKPSFRAIVERADEPSLTTPGDSEVHRVDIETFIDRIRSRFDWPPVRVKIERSLPAHTGFGSKTTSLLAIGKACSTLFGAPIETELFAQVAQRAGTSGASVNLIDRGGFLIDGGHKNPEDFVDDPNRYLVPSRFAKVARKPPVLINMSFPPWPILVIITKGTKLHGQPELDWFERTLPIPVNEAHRTAHHMLMHMAPAVAEADYGAFCRSLNSLTYEHYYKREQLLIQPPSVQEFFEEARNRPEIDSIGLSVTGPMAFAFTRRPNEALQWCEQLRRRGVVERWFFSRANNEPCRIEGWTTA